MDIFEQYLNYYEVLLGIATEYLSLKKLIYQSYYLNYQYYYYYYKAFRNFEFFVLTIPLYPKIQIVILSLLLNYSTAYHYYYYYYIDLNSQ